MRVIFENDQQAAKIAADFLRQGKIIAFASDTIYGLAADATNPEAVARLYDVKKRSLQKPIAIFLPDLKMADKIMFFDEKAKKIAAKFMPGKITLVLPMLENPRIKLAKNLNKNDQFLGFRIIKSEFIIDLFKIFLGPIAVSSANISGEKSAINSGQIKNSQLASSVDLLVDGGVCESEIASTIIKISDSKIDFLREGEISFESIKSIFTSENSF